MIVLNYADRTPIYEQIVNKVKEMVLLGILKPDEQLPSVRQMAIDLSVNPNTIQKAYAQLEREKIIYCITGRGNYISGNDTLLKNHQKEILEETKKLVEKAKLAGVSKEALVKYVEDEYQQYVEDEYR